MSMSLKRKVKELEAKVEALEERVELLEGQSDGRTPADLDPAT